MNALYGGLWLLAMVLWGDLKRWKKYYPTLLFFMIGDFLYLYLLSDHFPLWTYNPQGIDETIGITNTHVTLSIMFVKYPATTFIYLAKFPETGRFMQILYGTGWVGLYTLNEFIDRKLNLIVYDNGWNFYWSILFNVVMFTILRIHYCRPLVAWGLSILFILFLWNIFNVPSEVFR
ncbi:hypothetical protein M3181_15285 [Mesobacillus maritimus]|uniref:CBO0543 family protein n=1 Tax=Mesobacillus maritimus TaxID=1643336 RepID=UPI00203E0DA1|nr:CBO0543 family protein [Mesobacillus maritimus]MCM3670346.1 hypothetical protein [Mesobacillus maritimus]